MGRVGGRGLQAAGEEAEPAVPVAMADHAAQAVVILRASGLEPRRDGQRRLTEHPCLLQVQHNEQPADPPVAVVERVEGLE